jgi:sugar phosphate permease
MFGSSGGSAGQFLVGPMIAAGVAWSAFWIGMGVAGLLIAGILFVLLPKQSIEQRNDDWIRGSAASLAVVFRNPQTLLCGLVAGLLFIPTTIFDMIWGVRFLEEGRGFDYGDAVIRSATVPLGWLIGSPLLGLLSDRLGRRKPVIVGGGTVLFACLAWILYGPGDVLPPYVLGLVAGVASGGAMLTYTICKESNPPHLSGTATGVISFLNFTFSALVQPLLGWVMANVSVAHLSPLERYQTTFGLLLYGVALAVVLALVLRETGPGARVAVVTAEAV